MNGYDKDGCDMSNLYESVQQNVVEQNLIEEGIWDTIKSKLGKGQNTTELARKERERGINLGRKATQLRQKHIPAKVDLSKATGTRDTSKFAQSKGPSTEELRKQYVDDKKLSGVNKLPSLEQPVDTRTTPRLSVELLTALREFSNKYPEFKKELEVIAPQLAGTGTNAAARKLTASEYSNLGKSIEGKNTPSKVDIKKVPTRVELPTKVDYKKYM